MVSHNPSGDFQNAKVSPVERNWKDLNDFKVHTKRRKHKDACEAKAAAECKYAAREREIVHLLQYGLPDELKKWGMLAWKC
jgi:hypothetical protein